MLNYDLQLQWMHALYNALHSSGVDFFFILLSYVDTLYFYLSLIVCIWYLWKRSLGISLFYLFVLSSIFNQGLKWFFDLPRPCQIDPTIGLLCDSSPGFPSGGAQSAILIAGVICLESSSRFFKFLAIIFALLLCFSRVYLGVHYPTDILGGLVSGGILLFVYARLFPVCARHWQGYALVLPGALWILGRSLPALSAACDDMALATLGVIIGLLTYRGWRATFPLSLKVGDFCFVALLLTALFSLNALFPAASVIWKVAQGFVLSCPYPPSAWKGRSPSQR